MNMDIYIIIVLHYETVRGKMGNGVNYLSKFDACMKGHVIDVLQ